LADTWTVLRILEWTSDFFSRKGIEGGRREAELLLATVLKLDRVGLYLNFDRPLSEAERHSYRELVEQRGRREPLQYILGETEFFSLPFKVVPGVLIPRADSEVLVEEALRLLDSRTQGAVLDIGTGSGALAIAIAHERECLQVRGVDVSATALQVARDNAERNGVDGRTEWLEQDLFALAPGAYALVVSNPPYIPSADIPGLMPEVRDFEPHLALDGGSDGLDAYRALARQAGQLLQPGGWLLVEVGFDQAAAVSKLWEQAGLTEIFVRRDYAGIERVVGGCLTAENLHPSAGEA